MMLEPRQITKTKPPYEFVTDETVTNGIIPEESIAYPLWKDRFSEEDRFFLVAGGRRSLALSPKQIWRGACRWAQLLEAQTEMGDRVLISLENGRHFIEIFFACVLSGRIAVPLVHHLLLAKKEFYDLILGVQGVVAGKLIVSDLSAFEFIDGTPLIHVEKQKLPSFEEPKQWRGQNSPEDLAFIQFSSGSTLQPKGVMLSHRAVTENIRQIIKGLDARPDDKLATWLPFYHDMGLIGGLLTPITYGSPVFLAAPTEFIRSPEDWMRLVSQERCTVIMGPDFYYRQLVKRVSQHCLDEIDLSCVRVAMSGAEPVSAKNCRNFLSYYSKTGLKSHVILPVYGLAENCLAVTFPKVDEELRTLRLSSESLIRGRGTNHFVVLSSDMNNSIEIVSCGRPLPGVEVSIVDREGHLLVERQLGEIVLDSQSAASGYYGQSMEGESSLCDNRIVTGDLGFMDRGELFIVGRVKDQIILNGKNFAPIDFERHLVELDKSGFGRVVAVGSSLQAGEEERVVILVEMKSLNPWFRLRMKRRAKEVLRTVGNGTPCVYIVPSGVLPRTSSGKIKRYKIKESIPRGTYRFYDRFFVLTWLFTKFNHLPVYFRVWQRLSSRQNRKYSMEHLKNYFKKSTRVEVTGNVNEKEALEVFFRNELASVLKVRASKIRLKRSFIDYDLDSVDVVGLNARLKETIVNIPLASFIQFQSAEELIKYLLKEYKDEVRCWYQRRA